MKKYDYDVSDDSALLCFECDNPPKGIFSSLLSYLINSVALNNTQWRLDEGDQSLRCNQVQLQVYTADSNELHAIVTIRVHLVFLEIKIERIKHKLPAHLVHRCIQDAVQEVTEGLPYDKNAALKQCLFFPCRCSRDKRTPHGAEYKEDECS